MTSQDIQLINNAVQLIEDNDLNFLDKLGVFKEKIAEDVSKYEAHDSQITHFLVFENLGKVNEINFYCEHINFSLNEIKNVLGEYEQAYNFRENYTQFTLPQKGKRIQSIFFIKDNKFLFEDSGTVLERTPQGKESSQNDILFNAFCIKLYP